MRVRFIYPWSDRQGKQYKKGDVADLPAGDVASIVNQGLGVRVDEEKKQEQAAGQKAVTSEKKGR